MRRGFLFRHLAALSAAVVLAGLASPPVSADGNAGVSLHKTVDPAQVTINPNIGVTLAVDKAMAIPGDTLTYTAVVTNPTATFGMGGDINAEAVASADSTVVYYWDELEACIQGCGDGIANPHWVGLATFEATQPGYQPVMPPMVHTGMTFAAQSVVRTGVVYPASGDSILGTVISPSATAAWVYRATIVFSPQQIAMLASTVQVEATRNVLHFEVQVRNATAAQPYTDPEVFTNPFVTTPNPGAITNLAVKFTLPGNTISNFPVPVPLAPGGSATATATFKVPVPAPRGAGETDAAYVARLHALDGSALTATAVAAGSGFSGTVYATSSPVTTNEFVPIVTIAKSGPSVVNAGDTETNPLTLNNIGGATAGAIALSDTVPSGGTGSVSGTPSTITPGGTASATATFPVPISQASGDLTDTASVTWQDANGNSYGPLSSSFTTTVHNALFGATLTLAPASAGPNVPGTTQTLTATLKDSHGNPIAGQVVQFAVTGANPATGNGTTDANGIATFTYSGANSGNDSAQATVSAPGITITSNTSAISWLKLLQPVAQTTVQGNFFANPNNSCTFDIGPTATPLWGQTFPDIMFNPDPAIFKFPPPFIRPDSNGVVFNISTRPFTDITTDVNGNPNGQIIAQGNGLQAGLGSQINFYGVFAGNFIVNAPGDLTFRILHDDGYILGVGNGATRVNGDLENNPATTPFNNYGVVGAFNGSSSGASSSGPVTVHFPSAGTYPFELDYTECAGGPLFLDLLTESFVPQTSQLGVYVGYADALRQGGSAFPFPWMGSTNVNFFGCTACRYDAGALRFDNNTPAPITFDSITVDLAPGQHFDIWPHGITLPPGQLLVLTQTTGDNAGNFDNFDTSDFSGSPCNVSNGVIPSVNVTIGGVTTTYKDVNQVLNTFGFDLVCLRDESLPWRSINGVASTINEPLPPAASLNLTPFNIPNAVQGQSVSVAVSALDGAGNPQVNLSVNLDVIGANTQTQTQITNAAGLATFTYAGNLAGTDSLEASAFIGGLRSISNQGTVLWTPPGGNTNNPLGATITGVTPPDGSIVTKPIAIGANITPPLGQTITSWRVFYQALDPGPQVVIASGTGTPPTPLATFDPTQLPNDTYAITVEATSSNGAVQQLSTTVVVTGNLKLGRYVSTYQDMAVPVGGFQMEVLRIYDSIDPSSGDFGVGWHVSVSNFRTAPNRVLGAGGWVQYNKSCTLGLCFTAFTNSAPRYVSVTFPDRHTETFDFSPSGGTNLFWECSPAFAARGGSELGGSTSSLVAVDDTACSYTGDGNIYGAGGRLYDPHRFKLTTRDGRQFVLDRALGLVSETDSNGNSLTIDQAGIHATIGPLSSPSPGPSINFTRDGSNRITDIVGPAVGQHFQYRYTGNELTSVIDPMGNTVTYTYDAASGKLQRLNDPNNQPLQSLTYDPTGRLISIANGNQPPTTISTNLGSQQQILQDPNGKLTTVLTYDDLGDVIQVDNVFNGRTLTTHYSYDAVGRLTLVTDPLLHSSGMTYDESDGPTGGNVLTVFANGRTWSLENYNSFGEPGLIREPGGAVLVALVYDSTAGHLLSAQAPGQAPTVFTYWPGGQLKSVTDPGGRSENFAYDTNGNLASISDSQGRTERLAIDAAGLVRSVTDEIGNQTVYDYYPDGSLQALTDANLHKVQYFYDSLLRLQRIQDPLGHSTQYDYNDVGLLARRTDRNGAVTSYSYDADGRLIQEVRPNNDVTTFTHDPLGQLIGADNFSGHIDRTYDDAGRMTSETTCASTGNSDNTCAPAPAGPQPRVTISYDYYADDQLKSITSSDPGVPGIQFAYEPTGRLASVQYGSQSPFSLTYDSLGRLSAFSHPNGIVDSLGYNPSGDLISRDSTLDGNVVARFDYGIDPATGQRTSLTDNLGTHTFAYLDNGWLKSATHPQGSGMANEIYSYDAAGNRSSAAVPSSFDAANRLQADGTYKYAFDAEGNLVSKSPLAGGPGTTYTWNADHQLLGITYPDGTSSTYRYDPFGRRVAAVEAGQETRFVYDGLSVEADYNSQNQLETSYLGRLESMSQGQATYFLTDPQGTVRALSNAAGAVVAAASYDSFGMSATGNPASARVTFGGYQHDALSGLYYAGARYYDSATGRFISEDPMPSRNPYPYAGDDPANLIDLYGMQPTAEYAELLSVDSDVSQCVAGEVAAVSGPSLDAAAGALAGGVPTEAGVLGEIAGGLLVNEAQCSVSALAAGSKVRKVGGRNPRNYRYAGGVHPSGVRYNEHGFPNFAPYAKATVRIEGLTGAMWHDEPLANAAAGLHDTPQGYVWHHVEDCVTMQLIPQAIHDIAPHTGGAAIISAGEC